MTLKIAIVGIGKQGQEHVRACLQNPTLVRLVSVCDPNADWSELPGKYQDIARCRTVDELLLLSPTRPDAVIVATPPTEYCRVVRELAAGRVAIMLEKPFGMKHSEAGELLEACGELGSNLVLAAQRRFHPSYQKVSELLREMDDVRSANLELFINAPPVDNDATEESNDGPRGDNWRDRVGTMLDLGFHAIDLGRMWFGELKLIAASVFDARGRVCRDRRDVEAHLLFRTESGTQLRIRIGRASVKSERFRLQAENQSIDASREHVQLTTANGKTQRWEYEPTWTVAMSHQLREWIDACPYLNPSVSTSAIEGLLTMQLIEEAYARPEFA